MWLELVLLEPLPERFGPPTPRNMLSKLRARMRSHTANRQRRSEIVQWLRENIAGGYRLFQVMKAPPHFSKTRNFKSGRKRPPLPRLRRHGPRPPRAFGAKKRKAFPWHRQYLRLVESHPPVLFVWFDRDADAVLTKLRWC